MFNSALFKYIPSRLKRRILILLPLLSISGVLEVVSLALLIPLISLVLQPSNELQILNKIGLNNYTTNEKLVLIFGLFVLIIILKGIFVYAVSKYTFTTALEIKVLFQNRLFKGYLQKEFIQHLNSNSANYLRNITTECHQIEGRFIMPGLTLIAELLPVIFVVAFLVYLNPLGVFIAVVVFGISGFLITKTTSKYLKKYGKDQIASDGMQIKIAKEAFNNLTEIVLYKKEEKISHIFDTYTHKSADLISNALALGQVPKFVLEIVGLLTISLIAYISFLRGATANEVLIELAVFMGAVVKLLPSANRIVMNLQSLTHAKPAIENILKELESFEEMNYEDAEKDIDVFNKIVLYDMSFKYPNSNDYVLKDVNLTIKKGDIVGLKGESGSGKSTLINLLLSLLNPISGKILINDILLSKCKKSWQSMIAYVPQEVVLFDDTLRNNVAFYQDEISNAKIVEVLKKVKMEQFVDKLDIVVGEGGSSLSGGQKQRIAIARALVRKPQFIIFDEATSALDNETEKEINKLIRIISKETTILIIAHRQSALEVCDKIYRIKNGTIDGE